MDQIGNAEDFYLDPTARAVMEGLIAVEPLRREQALKELESLEEFQYQPLAVYLLATRILDPDLAIRYRAVQMLGGLLDFESEGICLPDRTLKVFTAFTDQMEKGQLIKLLEVAAHYLAAEQAIIQILRLCSYAGELLGGILNDRKIPVEIRQQAIYFSGEVGFLSTAVSIRNLIQWIEKDRARAKAIPGRKKRVEQEYLYPLAVAALGKLEG